MPIKTNSTVSDLIDFKSFLHRITYRLLSNVKVPSDKLGMCSAIDDETFRNVPLPSCERTVPPANCTPLETFNDMDEDYAIPDNGGGNGMINIRGCQTNYKDVVSDSFDYSCNDESEFRDDYTQDETVELAGGSRSMEANHHVTAMSSHDESYDNYSNDQYSIGEDSEVVVVPSSSD